MRHIPKYDENYSPMAVALKDFRKHVSLAKSKTLKICVDGGFTCPNRDGTCGYGGCIFCGEDAAGENIKGKLSDGHLESIVNQIKFFLNSYRGERANKFIAFFQSFSNTYDTIDNLRARYDVALSTDKRIIGLQIATRPDLINDEVVRLLNSYTDKYYVCVELGFQTANDNIGKFINRGYFTNDFVSACQMLKSAGIDVVGHMMIGLPGETNKDIKDTLDIINDNCRGIKIHSTYVQKNTILEKLYNNGEYLPITQDYYVDKVCFLISNLNPEIIVHRISAEPPKNLLVAPEWTTHKKIVLNSINKKLVELDIIQGDKKKLFENF